ncbi:UNVERIFIED_CONTAM: hypothetical protein Slati_3101800 [Sesamum latifolium]|uniref:Uncharacterized protein n=1 Tax=Sesamum latifolium TaxID=2727402 RepID=A0AAW2UU57_9LAMI
MASHVWPVGMLSMIGLRARSALEACIWPLVAFGLLTYLTSPSPLNECKHYGVIKAFLTRPGLLSRPERLP